MADDSDKHDRTEPATQKRIDEARKNGQIPRSRDLTAAAVMLTAGVAMQSLGGVLGARLAQSMRTGLTLSREQSLDSAQMLPALAAAALNALLAVGPILLLTMVAALGAPLVLGGWSFSTTALMPKFDRLNPGAGIGRMFSARAGVELGKALAKFGVVSAAGVLVLWVNFGSLMGLGAEPVGAAIGHAISISGQSLIALTSALILIAAIDVPFQLWQHHRDLRMTLQEVKQEARENDGNPEMKGHIRRMQREIAERRMMVDVAKGADFMAAKIREVATANNVPIFEAPPLARALHRNVEIGDEIPANLYVAVAQVLTYIFQLRAARRDHQQPPAKPVIEFTE